MDGLVKKNKYLKVFLIQEGTWQSLFFFKKNVCGVNERKVHWLKKGRREKTELG